MKFSFLLPAYKVSFLEQSINSILNQKFKDFEIIISDDCSPNNIKEIVNNFHDSRITYQRNDKNIGAENMVNHWNLLLSQAKGEYVIVASDDDIYEPNFLEEIDKLINKYPQVDLFRARVRNINTQNEPIWEDALYPEFQDEFSAICSYSTVCVGNYVFKTSEIKKGGGFFYLPYAMGSDTATAILMAKNGMCNTSSILFNYRISNIQVSHASKNTIVDKGKMEAALRFHTWMYNYLNNISYKQTLLNNIKKRKLIQERVIRGLYHCAQIYCGALSFKEVLNLYKTMISLGCFNRLFDKILFFIDYLNLKKTYR